MSTPYYQLWGLCSLEILQPTNEDCEYIHQLLFIVQNSNEVVVLNYRENVVNIWT